jgi:3-phosphoglycerate kinase
VAVLTDEMMEKFWVMKLLNDSTAIKVEIIPGVRNNDVIEVKEPLFKESDQFLISGNYGLPDTAFVKVIH